MTGKPRSLRLPDEIDTQVESALKKRKIPFSDFANQALKHFLSCGKEAREGTPEFKRIVLKFPGVCIRKNCSRKGVPLEVGDWALWARGVGLICLDCYIERSGDKAIVTKYLKMRELDKLVNALRKEAATIADTVEVSRSLSKFNELHDTLGDLSKLVRQYLTEGLGTEKEKALLDKIDELTGRGFSISANLQALIERIISSEKWHSRKPKKKNPAIV